MEEETQLATFGLAAAHVDAANRSTSFSNAPRRSSRNVAPNTRGDSTSCGNESIDDDAGTKFEIFSVFFLTPIAVALLCVSLEFFPLSIRSFRRLTTGFITRFTLLRTIVNVYGIARLER